MRKPPSRTRAFVASAVLLALASTAAWAFPWDIDLTDSLAYKAYEWKMMPLPDGAQSANRFRGGYSKMTRMMPEGDAMASPFTMDDDGLARGERLFSIYCQTCHGVKGQGGAPMADMSDGKKRYPIPPAILSGTNAVTPMRSDGYIFLTVQQGGAIMPSYGYALGDEEIWSIVAYIRTLEGAQYKPAAPPAPVTP